MNKYLPAILTSVAIIIVTFAVLFTTKTPVQAANVEHVVISEIHNNASDEFIELYNPSDSAVDLTGWSLKHRSAGGTAETNLISSMSGSIASHGFFLIVNDDVVNPPVASDATYSSSFGADNTIILYDDTPTLVDKVGFGAVTDSESSPTEAPSGENSIERKACSSSSAESMVGSDATNGNAEDSDNNANDFVLREVSDPQNSLSDTEVPGCTEATATPTESPTATPTQEPTNIPTPSTSPMATASAMASPTATVMPTKTPKPGNIFFPTLVCGFTYRSINFGWVSIKMPFFSCRSTR